MDRDSELYLYDKCKYCGAFLYLWAGGRGGVYVKCDAGHEYMIPVRAEEAWS